MKQPIIAFIGAGNMASSLIGGLIGTHFAADKIWASNPHQDQLDKLYDCFQIHTTQSNKEAAEQAEVIVLAVKPASLKSVVLELKDILQRNKPLIISVVTGINCATIQNWAGGGGLAIVRCMANTPALLGCGVTGLWSNAFVFEEQKATAESILRAVGMILWFKNEADLDTVTAISGSGPAYFFLIMEVMIDCAKQMGLSEEQAELLTINTALGAAKMALETGKDVKALREQVTSPGGTTEQAIKVLESGRIRPLFLEALEAAKNKAVEISKLLG